MKPLTSAGGFASIRGARQKYGSNYTYFRGTPLFVAYYRDQISRIYATSTAALVQNLAVFALEKIGKSSRSLSIVILKNSKKRNDSRHGTNHSIRAPLIQIIFGPAVTTEQQYQNAGPNMR